MVRGDGLVKVLDFGLARDLSAVSSKSAMPAGTLRYLSPEQSTGEAPSPASDVFSLGIVLYELAAGRHPFERGSIFETLQALNQAEPDPPSSLNAFVPPHVDGLILRMLARDPDQRPRAAEIANLLESRFTAQPIEPPRARKKASKRGPRLLWAVPILTVAVMGYWGWSATHPPSRPLIRFNIDLGRDAIVGMSPARLAVSPDETRLAYVVRSPAGANLLAVRLLDQSQPTVFAGTEGAFEPFFSPDSQWIGFFTPHQLNKISIHGGAPVALCSAEATERGAAWGTDGFIIANLDNSHLVRLPENGGQPEMLRAKPEDHGERTWRWPQILPGGKQVLFTGSRGSGAGGMFEAAAIEVLSLETGKVTVVHLGGYFGRYLPTGHLVYIHEGTLFAVPLDLARLKTEGAPVPIVF